MQPRGLLHHSRLMFIMYCSTTLILFWQEIAIKPKKKTEKAALNAGLYIKYVYTYRLYIRCAYTYTYVHLHICTYTYTHTRANTYTYTERKRKRERERDAHTNIHAHVHRHTCTRTHMHTKIHKDSNTDTDTENHGTLLPCHSLRVKKLLGITWFLEKYWSRNGAFFRFHRLPCLSLTIKTGIWKATYGKEWGIFAHKHYQPTNIMNCCYPLEGLP